MLTKFRLCYSEALVLEKICNDQKIYDDDDVDYSYYESADGTGCYNWEANEKALQKMLCFIAEGTNIRKVLQKAGEREFGW